MLYPEISNWLLCKFVLAVSISNLWGVLVL